MSTDPSTSPTAEAGNTLEALTCPHGPTDTDRLPRRLDADRDLWDPLRVVFPARHHPDIDRPRVMERHPRQRHTRLNFPRVGAGIFWTRGPFRILVPA